MTSTTRCVAKAFQIEITKVIAAIGTYPPYRVTLLQRPYADGDVRDGENTNAQANLH